MAHLVKTRATWATLRTKGATLVDYGMVVGLIAFTAIGGVLATGAEVKTILCVANNGIREGVSIFGSEAPIDACTIEVAEGATPGDGSGSPEGTGEEAGGGEDAGGGEGVGATPPNAGTEDTPAVTPREVVGTYRDFTYVPGRSYTHSQTRYAFIRPAEAFTFTASTADGATVPGTLSACMDRTCGPAVAQGASTVSIPMGERFSTSFRFVPSVGLLEGFSFPVTLTLASVSDPSRSWSQTVTVQRQESSVGIASLSTGDIVLDPGAYGTHTLRTAPVLVGPAQAMWRATLTKTPASSDAATINATLLGAGNWTQQGPAVRTFATSDANVIYRYFGQMLQEERYNALSGTFTLTLESLEVPEVTTTETFTVTREAKDLAAPSITVADVAVKAGKFGAVEFDATLIGDGGKILSIEALSDDQGNSGPPLELVYARGSGYNLQGPLAMPATIAEAGTVARLRAMLPTGESITTNNVWSYKALIASTQDANKRSVAEFTITRPAASFSAELNLADLTLPANAARYSTHTSSTPINAMDNLLISIANVTPQTAAINSALRVNACLSNTCTNRVDLTRTTPVTATRTASTTAIVLNVYLENAIDTYAPLDLEFDVTLALNGAPQSTIEQRVRLSKPAGEQFVPVITLAPSTTQEASGNISIPFLYRSNDNLSFSFTNLPAGATSSVALVSASPNATMASSSANSFAGYLPAPTTKEGTIIINMPTNQQAIDHTFTLMTHPYGPGFSYTSRPAVETPFHVKRAELQKAAFSNVPTTITLPAFGTRATLPTMAFLNPPSSGSLFDVYVDTDKLKNTRLRLCWGSGSCTNFVGSGYKPADVFYGVAGPVWLEVERSSSSALPSGSFLINPYHKGTNRLVYGTPYTITVN